MIVEEDEEESKMGDQTQKSHELINVASMKHSLVEHETTPVQHRKFNSASKVKMPPSFKKQSEEVVYEDSRGTP